MQTHLPDHIHLLLCLQPEETTYTWAEAGNQPVLTDELQVILLNTAPHCPHQVLAVQNHQL